jgi:hypothetical protein
MPEVVIPAALIKATSKINESSSSIGFVPTTFRLIGSTLPPKIYAYDEDIDFKKKIRKQSKLVVLLIDNTKIGLSHNYKGLDFEDIDFLVIESRIIETLLSDIVLSKSSGRRLSITRKSISSKSKPL